MDKDNKKKTTTKSAQRGNSKTKSNNVSSKKKTSTTNKTSTVAKKKKSTSNKKITTEKALLMVFVLLLIVVVVLSIMVFKKKKENEAKVSANIAIPVLKKGMEEEFSLNVPSLVDEKEYVFKLTNYRDKKINKEEIPYTITVENDSDSEIEVTKDYSAQNLMIDQEAIIIEDQKLRGKERQDVFYHVRLKKSKNVEKDDIINIKVAS